MAKRDVMIDVSARRLLRRMTSAERSDIWKIINEIASSPEPDNLRRYRFAGGDFLYNDPSYWVLYQVLNDYTIAIMGVGTN